jgi:hypothetical protein
MKIVIIAVGLLGLTVAGSAHFGRGRNGEPWRAGMSDNGFAVVELFTSEGCSSCPPADALIARVQQEDKDLPVYLLAYHVDYWDRLGWKDAFSNAAYSDRQRQYAAWLKLSSIYTPQVVVNGQKEFVGSESGELHGAIKNALQQTGAVQHSNQYVQLTLSGLRLNGGHLDWVGKVEGGMVARDKFSLFVAVVQRSATTQVKSGENGGRTLSHVQIVRELGMSALDGKGGSSGHLDWPAGIAPADGEVIAFLQNEEDGQIIAATRSAVGQ